MGNQKENDERNEQNIFKRIGAPEDACPRFVPSRKPATIMGTESLLQILI
jgi:hypothetical protein